MSGCRNLLSVSVMETKSCSIVGTKVDQDHGAPERLIRAVADRDFKALAATIAPNATMRMLVPRGPLEDSGNQAIADRFERWFGSYAKFELERSEVVPMAHRVRIVWRFRVTPHAESEIRASKEVEQVLFCDMEGTTIRAIDLLCSGFIAELSAPEGARHSFDAGDLGCGAGLAEGFRRQIDAIPVGDALEVVVSDPVAKSDLPALARMLGHSILSAEARPGERLAITVEKRRTRTLSTQWGGQGGETQ
jgi:TusA-related sulfurtransferase